MLATFVIGLREGLEAALIVGIIAAFLRRNGKSVAPMWWGIAVAVALSATVGIVLEIIESNLDQATQEGMETVIGAVAVFFVTSMVVWMSTNARGLKVELEGAASKALADGTSRALVLMAFLAVLKEGFETAVFLLATFQAAGNVATAATGAVLGVLVAIALGYGLYRGGVRINLSKFFKATGIFLVLVAAGLVVNALRTAHEAGWLNAGQSKTFDLSWLAPGGSVRGALLTGVLGIPAQPRLVEVLGWLAYVVPLCLYLYLPAHLRPSRHAATRLQFGGAAACVLAALALHFGVPKPGVSLPSQVPTAPSGHISLTGTTLRTPSGQIKLKPAGRTQFHGLDAEHFTAAPSEGAPARPAALTADQLIELNGGRMPVGVNAQTAPGPYTATWNSSSSLEVTAWQGTLLDATSSARDIVTLSGGGLRTRRTLTIPSGAKVPGGTGSSWRVTDSYATDAQRQVSTLTSRQGDADLWRHLVPAALLLTAVALLVTAARARRAERPTNERAPAERPAATRPPARNGATAASQTRTVQPRTIESSTTETGKRIHANH